MRALQPHSLVHRQHQPLRLLLTFILIWVQAVPMAAPSLALSTNEALDSAVEAAPTASAELVASKTDSLLVDKDGDGRADPGDTIRYTVTTTNTGTLDATDLVISDTLDPHTSLVAGSARISPLAMPDQFSTLVNTPLTIGAPGLLGNDSGTPNPTVQAFSGSSTAGGLVTIQADGSFTYTPPNNFSGSDSFTYSATNSVASDNGLVTVQVESAPRVVSTSPANNASLVPANASITITFSEPVHVTANAFVLACPTGVPISFSNSTGSGPATSFTLTPASDMPETTVCTVRVVAGEVSDADTIDPPDTMASDYSFSFTTTDAAPKLVSTVPVSGTNPVADSSTIVVTFNESVNATTDSFVLECPVGTSLPFALSASPASSYTLTPNAALPAGELCRVTVVASEISDADTVDPPDQPVADEFFFFTVEAPPTVVSTTPANGASGVAADTNVTIVFSELVTIPSASAFSIECPTGGLPQGFTITSGLGPATSFVIDLASSLPLGTTCTVTVFGAQVNDADTIDPPDTMVSDYTFSFTTDAAPEVIGTKPSNGASNLATNVAIEVSFSEAVTLDANAFVLACPTGTPISLSVAPSSGSASSFSLTPSSALPANTTCSVTVAASAVHDADSADPPDTMASDFTFSFTTDAAPSVSSTTPADGASDLPIDSDITVVFSEQVNVTANTFALACPSGTPIAFTNTTGTGPASSFVLQPDADLPAGTTCTVTVQANQVSDVDAGDPPDVMAANYSFSFSTDAAPTVASTVPDNNATAVASNSNITITFSEAVNLGGAPVTLNCGSSITLTNLTGSGPATSFAFDPAMDLPIGTQCTVTVLAAQVSDDDSADPPDTMLADYTFSFTTLDNAPTVQSHTPADNATTQATDSAITVVFSEQVNVTANAFALECPTGTTIAFTNTTGNGPASSFSLQPNAALPLDTTCSVTVVAAEVTDADTIDPPDAMASDYSFSFTTDAAPEVQSTTPATGAIDVMLDTTIQVTFSESVQATSASFELLCASTPVAFSLSASPATVFTLTPSANLPVNTLCSVTVLADQIHDVDAGDPPDEMLADYTFGFTTVDDDAPTVTSTTPTNGATNLATNGNIVINFSESVNFSASSFSLVCLSAETFSIVEASPASSVTLDPTSNLPTGETCTVTVLAAGITDADSIDPPDALEADFVFSFTTDAPPSVTSTIPADGASDLPIDSNIVINFSENVNFSTSSFVLECPTDSTRAFTLSSSGATSALINPSSDLPAGVSCTVTVLAANISDIDSADPPDAMLANHVFSFTTDAPPSVTSTTPANGATNLATDGNIVINFSESVNFSESSFTIGCPSPVAFSLIGSSPAISVTLDPTVNLPADATCTVTVLAAEISDVDTNDPPDTMVANYVLSFTTDAAPSVTSTSPANNATNVARSANIVVNFSESVNFTTASFALACPTGTPIPFTLSASPGTSATLNPTGNLPAGVVCTVTVLGSGITDVDSADPPDTMVANYVFSFSVPPDAVDDIYSPQVIGNVGVNTDTSTDFSVLSNDEGPGIAITAFDATSAQGGTVALNTTTGTFTYTPPRGYEGGDSFTYTISNGTGSDVGTVNLTVSGMIWFVNASASADGDGRLNTPYNLLSTLNSVNNGTGNNPAAGDTIFLYGNATAYIGPITLLNTQKLVGQNAGVGLASVAGVTVPADSFALPTMGGAAPSSTITGAGITLGSNNTIRGLQVGASSGNIALAGTNFGTLFVREVGISGASQALNLNTGTLDTVFSTLTSTGGTNNVALQSVSGTLSVSSGTLSGATGTAFVNDGGSATISFPGPISKTSAGLLLNITNRTANAVTLNGALTCNSGCTGISVSNNSGGTITMAGAATLATGVSTALSLTNNAGTTIALSGSLTITTSSGNGISASGGGTITITGAVNTVASTTGTAVNINGVTIGAAGITLRSVSANGGTNGIVLNNTGAGPFTINGNAAANTGGTIQNTTGPGMVFTSTGPITLNWIRIADGLDDGIRGTSVNGFTINNSTIINNGNAIDENGIDLTNTTGTLTISSSTVTQSQSHNVVITNTSGTLNAVNVTGSTFSAPKSSPVSGLFITLPPSSSGATISAISVTNNTFTNNTNAATHVNAESDGIIGMFTFSGNTLNGNDIGVNVSTNGTASVKFDIKNNPIMHGTRTQVNIAANDTLALNGVGPTMEGYVRNNPSIKTMSTGSAYLGMWVVADGDGRITVDFTNNHLLDYGESGLAIESRHGNGRIDAHVKNNVIDESTAVSPFVGLFLRSGGGTTGETNHLCVNVVGNNVNAGPGATSDYRMSRYLTASTFSIQGLTPSPASNTQAATFIEGTDIALPATSTAASGSTPYTAATCNTPSFALQAAEGEGPGAANAQVSQAQLDAAVATAIEHWEATGVSAVQGEQLRNATVQIADLDAGLLGSSFGSSVDIDRDAAGWGWNSIGSTAVERYDLLTVVEHELGHVLGIPHTSEQADSLMTSKLMRGVRYNAHTQTSMPANVVTTPNSVEAAVATLPAGKRVILMFDVVIASPLPESVTQIANQARISATGLVTVLSDDPERSGTADPTITLLDTLKKVYLPLVMKEPLGIDLAVKSITLSPNKSQFRSGEPVEITVVIKNEGQTASPAFWVDLYINPSQVPSANSAWNELCQLSPCYGMAWPVPKGLAAGESITLSSKTLVEGYSIWPGSFAAGTNELYVQADSWRRSGGMIDINRANNVLRIGGLQVTGTNPSAAQTTNLRERPAAEACCRP
jgi:methionine-rich copper-binding protein CopC